MLSFSSARLRVSALIQLTCRQPLLQRGAQVADQHFHLGLGLGREIFLDVDLSHQFPQRIAGERDAALPAITLLRLAAQLLTVEGEVRFDRSASAGTSVGAQQMERAGNPSGVSTDVLVQTPWRCRESR